MLPRLILLILLVFAPTTGSAAGPDLGAARADAAILTEALAFGERGEWDAAEDRISRADDALLSDIVLWRRLRAGEGTAARYAAFVKRRPDWPGRTALARAVFGVLPPDRPVPPPTGRAARNLHAFDAVWQRRDMGGAARLLDQITVDPAGLGRPTDWQYRRRVLVRAMLREGDPRLAYRLASRHHLTPADGYAFADLEWLSGWIALGRLSDADTAVGHFARFADVVETPISLGRAGYWMGRAEAARGNAAEARSWYALAARHQTSFYGQLAAEAIGASGDPALTATDLPDWQRTPALQNDRVRMAVVLHFAGRDSLSFQSFVHIARTLRGPAPFAALGDLLLELDRPTTAVRVAKIAARDGIVLPAMYYPLHPLAGYAEIVEPALAMSIARQETELNPRAVSPAGARGLMQLMPATARRVAGWIDEPYAPARLTGDWRYNARLGQTYLARRVRQYDGSYVLAAAAYNAGAHRVDRWIEAHGDPRTGDIDMIDWIETIPFRETRNYVQRVMEGLYVYRTRLAGTAGPMTIGRDLARGAGG